MKTNAKAKFDETVEVALNLGVDPKHADQMVRGMVGMPNGIGKTLRAAVSPKARRPMKRKPLALSWSVWKTSPMRFRRANPV